MLDALSDYWRLVRPRIVGLVLFTMTVAALIAGREVPPWPVLVHAVLGSGLVIAGAVALNQRLERRSDAKMPRTAPRPLPSERLTNRQVTRFGLLASAAGLVYLVALVNPATVLLAAASWVIYVCIYTPLKPLSTWQTPIGAIAGAMPTLLGAAAAGALWSTTSLVLFGIVYLWQFPHSMAVAWIYRRELAAADLKVATVVDPSGRMASLLAVLGAAALLPVSLVPWLVQATGWRYGACASVLGVGYLAVAARFYCRRDNDTARTLLRASLGYLLVLLAALLASLLT